MHRWIGPKGSRARNWVRIPDRRTLIKLLLNPSLKFGDLYSNGSLQVEGDLWTLVGDIQVASQVRDCDPNPGAVWRMWRREPRRNPSTVDGAKGNIHHHYDLGNEFYRLWLDQAAMQYTCAYYAHPGMTLEQAQIAKLDHVCRKLRLAAGERLLDIGCGWGGLVRHAARHYGVQAVGITLSVQRALLARERVAAEGLQDRVEVLLLDYRDLPRRFGEGTFDKVLSRLGENMCLSGTVRETMFPNLNNYCSSLLVILLVTEYSIINIIGGSE